MNDLANELFFGFILCMVFIVSVIFIFGEVDKNTNVEDDSTIIESKCSCES